MALAQGEANGRAHAEREQIGMSQGAPIEHGMPIGRNGSLTPRAIQSVSASRSKVKAQAARASFGQVGRFAEAAVSMGAPS